MHMHAHVGPTTSSALPKCSHTPSTHMNKHLLSAYCVLGINLPFFLYLAIFLNTSVVSLISCLFLLLFIPLNLL